MSGRGLTYKQAGVDAELGDALVDRISARAKRTLGPGVVSGIGGFAALFSLKEFMAKAGAMSDPLLVSGTDGVGTKLKVAFAMNKHDTVGIDLVAMCVNDVITTGAQPLFFLDYFATGKLEIDVAEQVINGISAGCEEARCSLVGGETAELPGLYHPGEYDLAGFAVGVVDRAEVIDGRSVAAGDRLIGLASSGVHSNGYSLARRAVLERAQLRFDETPAVLGGLSVGEALIAPTRIYVRALEALRARVKPKALAHITGGGIPGNLPRVMPADTAAVLKRSSWPKPRVFDLIQEAGRVDAEEMDRTFNMGLGMIAIVSAADEPAALEALKNGGFEAHSVGVVEAGSGEAVARIE